MVSGRVPIPQAATVLSGPQMRGSCLRRAGGSGHMYNEPEAVPSWRQGLRHLTGLFLKSVIDSYDPIGQIWKLRLRDMTCLRSKVFSENPSCSDAKAHALSPSPSHPFLILSLETADIGARRRDLEPQWGGGPVTEHSFQNMALGAFPSSTYWSLVIL